MPLSNDFTNTRLSYLKDSIKNTNPNDPNLSQYQGDTPYLLKNLRMTICELQ